MQIQGKQRGSQWDKFKESRKESEFRIYLLSKEIVFHGLEAYEIKMDLGQIIRKNNDVMVIDKIWKTAAILPLEHQDNLNSFLCQFFYTHAVQRHIIYLHSSLIDHQGRGLMFLGPSGIGKTTQAELWNQ